MCKFANDNVIKSQVKGLPKEEISIRNDLVQALPERIQAIPDGPMAGAKQTAIRGGGSTSHKNIQFDSSGNYFYTLVQYSH